MEVDFLVEENLAKDIYLVKSKSFEFNTKGINDFFKNLKLDEKINQIKANGMQNRNNFIIAILFCFTLFLPFIVIFRNQTISLFAYSLVGKLLFLLSAILAFVYYAGIKRFVARIIVAIISIIVFKISYDIYAFAYLNGANFISYGFVVSLLVYLFLFYGAFFKKSYTEKF